MRILKIFINYVTERSIYNMDTLLPIDNLNNLGKELSNYEKITTIIFNYPGSYSGIRSSIAIGKALKVSFPTELLGFSLFSYFNHYNTQNFYIDKYMFWQEGSFGPLSELTNILGHEKKFICNVDTPISNSIDCSSPSLMNFINNNPQCLTPLKQIYHDKFSPE